MMRWEGHPTRFFTVSTCPGKILCVSSLTTKNSSPSSTQTASFWSTLPTAIWARTIWAWRLMMLSCRPGQQLLGSFSWGCATHLRGQNWHHGSTLFLVLTREAPKHSSVWICTKYRSIVSRILKWCRVKLKKPTLRDSDGSVSHQNSCSRSDTPAEHTNKTTQRPAWLLS